jgi:hypothetical protein
MTNTLQAKLARSLDTANTKARNKAAPVPAPLPADRRCTKISVSLFDGDIRRLETIQDYMRGRGERISTSQAVKLALRTAPLSDALQDALKAVKAEDGRKW